MTKVGFQDFWQVGARAIFEQDAVNGTAQPARDMGVLKTITPTLSTSSIKMLDPDGGVNRTVDEAINSIEESYDAVFTNFNQKNLALLFASTPPASFTQSATNYDVAHTGYAGQLLKIKDSSGTALYNLSCIAGVYYGGSVTALTVSAINATTKVITCSSTPGVIAGDKVILGPDGLTDKTNANTYTVASVVTNDVTVVESIPSTQGSVTGGKLYKANTGTILARTTGFSSVNLIRGTVILTGLPSDVTVNVIFATAALSGKRSLSPQALKASVKGTIYLYLGRDDNTRQHVRECRVSLAPSSTSLTLDDYSSFTVKITVLSTITDTAAGRLLSIYGDLPDEA